MKEFDIHKLWPHVPLPVRRIWWRETDYGRLQPSQDLKLRILNAANTEMARKSLLKKDGLP